MAISSAWIQRPTRHPAREVLAAELGQVAAGDHADLGRQVLDQHRHQVGREDHPQQQVAVLGAAGDVRGEVARVHVGHRGHERRAEQRQAVAHAAAGPQALERARLERRRRRALGAGSPGDSGLDGALIGDTARIARVSAPPSTCSALAEAHGERALERLALDDLEAVARARSRARRGSAASRGRSRTRARTTPRSPGSRSASGRVGGSSISPSRVGIGSPCGSCVGLPSFAAISSDELRRDRVLQHLGLLVHAVPGHAERLGEVELEQAVVAQHLERDALARRGQAHAVVGLVRDEPQSTRAA